MPPLVADENLDNAIIRGLRHKYPQIDIVRVQDVGLSGATDPVILEWAAEAGRILVTHDVSTITRYAYDRVRAGKPMAGVVIVSLDAGIGQVIEDLLLLLDSVPVADWQGTVQYLPL